MLAWCLYKRNHPEVQPHIGSCALFPLQLSVLDYLASMQLALALALQVWWVGVSHAIQHSPASWGHYDVCKSQLYTDDGLLWHYMACQPESSDMTKYIRVTLEPENITCGEPPEIYCALVSALYL